MLRYAMLKSTALQGMHTNDEHDGSSDEAEDDHVVGGHPDEPGVVDLSHLLGARLVGQEEAQDQLEALVSVQNACNDERKV